MTPAAAFTRKATVIRLALVAATFAAVHWLVLAGDLRVAVVVFLCVMVLGPGAQTLLRLWSHRGRIVAMSVALLGAVVALVALSDTGVRMALVVPPFLGYMATSVFFAHSLLPGEDPVITHMCRIDRGDPLPDGLEAYSRLLTWGWAILPATLAVGAVLLLVFVGIEPWSWMTNVVSPVILIAFFVGEHIYRGIRYPQFGRPSLLHTFDVMFHAMSARR
jgi:uncharacterized membrane protein